MKKLSLIISTILIVSLIFVYLSSKYRTNQDKELEFYYSLPYINHVDVIAPRLGVTYYNKDLAYKSHMLVNGNTVINREGKITHKFINGSLFHVFTNDSMYFHIFNNDVSNDGILYRYNLTGQLVWSKNMSIHHHLKITEAGNLLLLSSKTKLYNNRFVNFDEILYLSANGTVIENWSTYDNLDNLWFMYDPIPLDINSTDSKLYGSDGNDKKIYDYFHLNSVEEIPENYLGNRDKRFQKGNLLISLRQQSIIAILDSITKHVVWYYKKDILRQHSAKMLPSGNIILFDNGDDTRDLSRVVEIDPITNRIVWEYILPPNEYCPGFNEEVTRLPNQNTLIILPDIGIAREITNEKEIVWEWRNPEFGKNNDNNTVTVKVIDDSFLDIINSKGLAYNLS